MSRPADWMGALGDHYRRCRAWHPHDQLLIVFEIDGAILEPREDGDLAAARPLPGALEVIRWFQLQPSTVVGLNTRRPESLRDMTLWSLTTLGRPCRVGFTGELLRINPGGRDHDAGRSKVDGLISFTSAGYRLVAVVDDDPADIEAMAAGHVGDDILFLRSSRADSNEERPPTATPPGLAGCSYQLRSLLTERDLPRPVELVWHGVNDPTNLRHFLASSVPWGELDVRGDAAGHLVLQHDDTLAPEPNGVEHGGSGPDGDGHLSLADVLNMLAQAGRGAVLDLKEPVPVGRLVDEVRQSGIGDDRVCFNARVDVHGASTLRRLSTALPKAVLQHPIDFMPPPVAASSAAEDLLQMLAGWAVNRFSVSWQNDQLPRLLDRLDQLGYEANIYQVADLEQFLRAALLLPRSLTADFNFPEWDYFGRGPGMDGRYHHYRLATPVAPGMDA